ncbi:Vacuolar protein sorting-associated protein 53 [Ceratobasidium sp. 414]|nr:Vacuolar protein sorting-associated protein 53 [Ceratobasidium sp. 414]
MAIEHYDRAVSGSPDDSVLRYQRLRNLGGAYIKRFERMGRLEDINKATELFEGLKSSPHGGSDDKLETLNNLAAAYGARFERLGDARDIFSAILSQSQVLSLASDDDPRRADWLNNLGGLYQHQSDAGLLLGPQHFDMQVEFDREALKLTPDGSSANPERLHCLGISLYGRFKKLENLRDIDEAIDCGAQAVSLISGSHPSFSAFLNSLGSSYQARFEHLEKHSDINEAIECHKKVVASTGAEHPDGAIWLQNLGGSYLSRFGHQGDRADIERAARCLKKAAHYPTGYPFTRFNNARKCASLCLHHGISEPLQEYELAMTLVPQVIWLGTPMDIRYDQINLEIRNVAAEAAAAAISLQRYDSAIEWLEQGRSIIWGQSLQLRRPLDDLATVNPDLAELLAQSARELDDIMFAQPGDNFWRFGNRPASQRQRRLAKQWEELVQRARLAPGFSDFLQPKKSSELLLSAQDGVVVVINVHAGQCDALVLRYDPSDITHIPLTSLTLDKVTSAQAQLTRTLQTAGLLSRGVKQGRAKPEDTFRKVLAILWTDLVEPIVNFLGYVDILPTEDLPRITWCTTGLLSLLPIHAAGIYDYPSKILFNLAVSSYTPTLGALLVPGPTPKAFSGIMSVGQVSTPGFPPIFGTADELAQIKQHVNGLELKQLDGNNATTRGVLRGMQEHSWVHFACHATQNPTQPMKSAFHLHDGPLDLKTIAQKSLRKADMAFLSACQTATGDKTLPDEALHLAAGMVMVGYPTVIATMWSIGDSDAPLVAGRFYAKLLEGGVPNARGAARALHAAVAVLRDKVGVEAFTRIFHLRKSRGGMSEPTPLILRIQNILDLPPTNSPDALAGFDPVASLNELFPDEASLARVAAVQAQLDENIREIQAEIDGLRTELRRDQEPARMQLIQELIAELLAQMSRIREKAAESEAIVRDITKDIQVLDLAKKNLALSVTALKRFQMLVNALGQLDSLVGSKKYGEIAQTLAAVKEISVFFKSYSSIERIAVATRKLQEIQGHVRTSVERDFDDFFLQDPARPVKASTIGDACLVVDVLGGDVRNTILDRYSSLELKEYRRIFRSTDEAGQLDNISRRFAYFRRVLTAHDTERARAFPQAWRVGEHLTAQFAAATRADIVVALQNASDKANSLVAVGSGGKPKTGLGLGIGAKEREREKNMAANMNVPALTVSLLLEALKETLEFESAMERKFGISFKVLVERVQVPGHQGSGQTISSAFDSHMGLIIADLLATHRGVNARMSLEASSTPNANIDPDAPPPSILPSSTELFFAIAQGMEDCARLLGENKMDGGGGGLMIQMCRMHKKWLKVYAEDVLMPAAKRSDKERKSSEGRFNSAELQKLCLLLNTADYCQTTSTQLEEKMRDKVSDEEAEEVSLQGEQDLFVKYALAVPYSYHQFQIDYLTA